LIQNTNTQENIIEKKKVNYTIIKIFKGVIAMKMSDFENKPVVVVVFVVGVLFFVVVVVVDILFVNI